MANRKNTFLIKRSNVAGKVPVAGDLQLGELALNTADNILYASGTTANSILPIGWDRVARTGDTMTGYLYAPSISATTISATTYYNLPTDIFTTGGTYSTGTATFTNNTGGTFTVTGFSVGGGGGQVFYLNLSQSQNGNRLLSTTASTASEQTSGVTIANGVTSTIASFQSQPLNITLLPGGIWSFYLHSYKQNNNASFNIFVEVYKRTSGGTETLLFATDPAPVTTNSPNPSMQLSDSYFSGTSLNVSDSVVAVVRATNTGNQSHTITLVTEGSTHYSYVVSTIPTQQGLTCDTLSGCSIIQTIQTDISNKFDKSGGTVTGPTVFTSGLSANTISATTLITPSFRANNGGITATTVSATTYVNLPNVTLQQAYTASTSPEFTINSTQLGIQFRNNTGNDSNPMIVIQNNAGVDKGEWRADGSLYATDVYSTGVFTPIISAATYQNLPIDVGVTGTTYSNNTFTYTNNTGGTFNVYFNTVTGLTVNGNLTVTGVTLNGNLTVTGATNISGTTTVGGDVVALTNLKSMFSSGDEGGEIFLNKAVTNTTLVGGVVLDIYQNKLRFFESGGTSRGVYIDLTAAAAGVGTNLLSGGGGEINTASNLGSGTGLFAQKVAADLQFKSLTSTGGTVTISNDANTVNLEVVAASNFTGGTVINPTIFTNGLSANTFSATTYLNLPTDIRVTGGTYSNGTSVFTNNTGGTFNVTGYYTGGTDVFVTGGTYSNGSLSFVNNTGGTFNILTSTNYAAGVISGATYTSTGTGQVNLPAIKVALYNNANFLEPIIVYDVASGTTGSGGIPSLTDQDTNYIVVEYNGGTPRYYVYDNDGPVNNSSVVLFMIVYRDSNFVNTLVFGNQGAGLANKLNDRFIMTDRFGWESGLSLGLSGSTGIVYSTSGVAWNGPNRQSLSAVNSSGDTFFKNYHVGGVWINTTTGKTINNTYYDNGTDIVSATAGKYLTNWYFRGQETEGQSSYEVYSPNQYDNVALAQLSTEPSLPELITSHAILLGRIIIQVGASTGLTESAFNTVFKSTQVTSHDDLTGIQGGTAGQYYHITSNQYNNLALSNTDNLFSVSQTFNSGLKASTVSATTYQNLPFTGTSNYLPKWASSNSLGNSQIRDDGTNIGIGMAPDTDNKFSIITFSNNYYGLWVRNASNLTGARGIYGISNGNVGTQTGVSGVGEGHPTTGTSIGVDGVATDGLLGIGVRGTVGTSEFGSMVTGIGGYFDGRGGGEYGYPTISYSVQLLDGTEGIDKVLVSKTADGKANWSSTLSGLTSVNATTVSATTLIGDGSQISNITTSVPYGIISAIASGNYLI